MRGILNILKSPAFLIGFGFSLLLLAVLLGGALLQWSWTLRLLGVVVVLILCVVVLMVRVLRANRSSDAIEKSIKKQAQQQLQSDRSDRHSDIEEMQRQLELAIQKLKQSKLGQGKRGRSALYALPWYLFIGPPGAGKTTAIANSGLNFPLGSDRVRGVGGTRNCDWFFTDSAILLDTAGRYMTEEEDTEEWLAFLNTLKQHRPDRPINGVMVGIPLPDLSTGNTDEIEWHADNIRRRVDELLRHLGIRFPVYLVFTKCDLLQGFVEFFGELSRKDRDQIWGCTFDDKQQLNADPRAVFEQEFDLLSNVLVNSRTERLNSPMKREERRNVYTFPLQFASVKDSLSHFVARLFQPNPYQESPYLRGFYFTSGTQEGIPLDRVIQTIARQFELSSADAGEKTPETTAKSYFLKDFFTDVVVPDQYMARRTSKASRQGTVRRVGATVGAVLLLAVFLLGTSQALVRSKLSLNEAQDVAFNAGGVQWDNRSAAVDNLRRVEALRLQLDRLDQTTWLGLGLQRNGTVLAPSRRLYHDQVKAFMRVSPLRMLESNLQAAARSLRLEGPEREALTTNLKAYLLLTDETARLEDEPNRTFLVRFLTQLATTDFASDAAVLTTGELSALVEPQVATYVNALTEDSTLAFGAATTLIQQTRQRIDEPPSIQGLYARLRLEGLDRLPPFRLSDAVPGRYRDLLTSQEEVSGLYTRLGWDTVAQEMIQELSQNPTGEDWVMGRSSTAAPSELSNQGEVAKELETLYLNDYAGEWERFIRSVRVKRFADLQDAARSLIDLGNANESPISYLLAHMTNQMRFEQGGAASLLDQAAENLERRAERRAQRLDPNAQVDLGGDEEVHPLARRFQWLLKLNADQLASGGAGSDLYQAFASLRQVGTSLEGFVGDNPKAATYVADILKNNGGELNRELRNIGNDLVSFNPDARKQLFEAPVLQTWQALIGVAQRHLNDRWRTVLYEPFQSRFANAYPFNPTAENDAPIFDVEAFLAPESGTVDAFIKEELEPFTGRDLEQPLSWRGSGVRLSPATREAIRRARNIGANAFSGGRLRVQFELQPEIPERQPASAPVVDHVSLRLLGREETYRMGLQSWTAYDWPGTGDAVITLSTQTGDLSPRRYAGDWALFRMLQDARITQRSGAQFELKWSFDRPGSYTINAIYYLRTRSAANPFSDVRGFFNFRPPPTLE